MSQRDTFSFSHVLVSIFCPLQSHFEVSSPPSVLQKFPSTPSSINPCNKSISSIISLDYWVTIMSACPRIQQSNGDGNLSSPRKKQRTTTCANVTKVTVVLGAQWGDEGKGKVVDMLADDADVVCRCQVIIIFFIPCLSI